MVGDTSTGTPQQPASGFLFRAAGVTTDGRIINDIWVADLWSIQ